MKRKKKVQGEWGFTVKQGRPTHSRKGLVLWREVGERKTDFTEGEKCMAALSPGSSMVQFCAQGGTDQDFHPFLIWYYLDPSPCEQPALCTHSAPPPAPAMGLGTQIARGTSPPWHYSHLHILFSDEECKYFHSTDSTKWIVVTWQFRHFSWKVKALICICLRAGLQQGLSLFPTSREDCVEVVFL